MKIVVADDESLARVYLRSMLNEIDDSLSVVGEARNGEELLHLLQQHLPDVVYVDIRMPKLDGLNAIRRGKEISPHTQWVVLSGFSEFQYAQEALELGVSHYFLKPVRPSELHQSIEQIKLKSARSLLTLNNEFENIVVSLLHRCSRVTDLDPASPIRDCPMMGYLLFLDGLPPQTQESSALSRFVKEVRKAAVDHLFSKEGRVSLTTLPEGQLSIIYASTCSSPPSSIPQSVLRFERGLMELVQRYVEQHRLSVTPLQTGLCHGMEQILHELSELQTWGSMRTVIPFGRCVKLEELMSDREAYQHSQLLNLARRVEKISTQYHTGDYLQYTKEVTLLSKDIRGLAPRDTERISFIQQFLERSLGVPVGDAKLDQWIRQLEIHGETNLLHALESGADSRDLVQMVIDYIDRNYMHDIGIGQIAQEVGVTYNYLSTIFHKKCGMTFIHYLTKTRMLKAKQLLLSHPHMKIQNVAHEVGYYSTRYFTKAFTKQFNCYPSEIRAVQQV